MDITALDSDVDRIVPDVSEITDAGTAEPAAPVTPPAPELPDGREVELDGLGSVLVREVPGPPGAPTVFLLHGWTASADLNFFTCYRPLGERFRVLAFDHRGHGRGLRTRKPFRLEDCADDVAAVADALGIDSFVPVGYSMGGPIAKLLWQRHPERVAGLVLCATAPYFAGRRPERLSFMGLTGLAALARYTPAQARSWMTEQFYLQRKSQTWGAWAIQQAASHDWRMVLEAGRAIGSFSSSDWIRDIDVPTAVITTMRDQVVPLRRQVKLFEWIDGAVPFRVDGAHDAVISNADRFVPQLTRALHTVTGRR